MDMEVVMAVGKEHLPFGPEIEKMRRASKFNGIQNLTKVRMMEVTSEMIQMSMMMTSLIVSWMIC